MRNDKNMRNASRNVAAATMASEDGAQKSLTIIEYVSQRPHVAPFNTVNMHRYQGEFKIFEAVE